MKAHIIGPAGSGKTTLARWISNEFAVETHDLDWIVYDTRGERPVVEVRQQLEEIASRLSWVTEGAYHDDWVRPLLEGAETIVWLDVSWPTCAFRIFRRHVAAELRNNNRHRGWLKMLRFLNYTRRVHVSSREGTQALLAPHIAKVVTCRSAKDIQKLRSSLPGATAAPHP